MRITDAASQQIFQLLSQLNKGEISVGDIITGRVIATDDGLLLLRLSDGSKISAQILTDGQYSLGDILNLEIIEEKQGIIFVRQTDKNIVPDETQKSPMEDLSALLKSLGLPADGKHLEIAEEIRGAGIEPTADIIKDALRIISEGKANNPKQAVFLVNNNMQDRQEYLPIFRGLLDGAFSFNDKWTGIIGDIKTLDEKTIMQIAKGLLANDTIADLDTTGSVNQIIRLYSEQDSTAVLDASARHAVDNLIRNILIKEIIKPKDSMEQITNPNDNNGMQTPQNLKTLPDFAANVPDSIETHKDFNSFEFITSLDDKTAFDVLMKQFMHTFAAEDKARQEEITGIIRNLLFQAREKLPDDSLTADKAIRIINNSMSKPAEKDTVKSFDVNLPRIDKWVRDTERKLFIIKDALYKSAGPEKERMQVSVRELDTALRFFQDIISYEVYAQVPLVLKEHSTQGDIYIMKRRNKKGKLNPDDFSVFISLTTVNLGTLDAFINVRNKNVMLRLMTEDEKYFGLIQEEYKTLYEALKEKGYNLYEIKCSLREEGINLINADKKASELVYPQNKKIDMRI